MIKIKKENEFVISKRKVFTKKEIFYLEFILKGLLNEKYCREYLVKLNFTNYNVDNFHRLTTFLDDIVDYSKIGGDDSFILEFIKNTYQIINWHIIFTDCDLLARDTYHKLADSYGHLWSKKIWDNFIDHCIVYLITDEDYKSLIKFKDKINWENSRIYMLGLFTPKLLQQLEGYIDIRRYIRELLSQDRKDHSVERLPDFAYYRFIEIRETFLDFIIEHKEEFYNYKIEKENRILEEIKE